MRRVRQSQEIVPAIDPSDDLPPTRTTPAAGPSKVSDGTRTRGRRHHNPANSVDVSARSALQSRLSCSQLGPFVLRFVPESVPVPRMSRSSWNFVTAVLE